MQSWKEAKPNDRLTDTDDYPFTELCDPVELTPYQNPIQGKDGFIYDQKTAERLLQSNMKSPFTGKPFSYVKLSDDLTRKFKNIVTECNDYYQKTQTSLKNYLQLLELKESEITTLKNQLAEKTRQNEQAASTLKFPKFLPNNQSLERKSPEKKSPDFLPVDLDQNDLTKSFNNTRFLKAVVRIDLDEVRYYLRQGANVNARNEKGEPALITAMHIAARSPQLGLLLLIQLCKYNPDINIKDQQGMTALHYAAATNDFVLTKFLLEKSANPFATNFSNDTPRKLGQLVNKEHFDKELEQRLIDEEARFKHLLPRQSVCPHFFNHDNSATTTNSHTGSGTHDQHSPTR